MTEVLSIPVQTNGSNFFGRSDHLRRTSSQSSFQTQFLLQSPTSYSGSSSNIRTIFSTPTYEPRPPASLPSSAPSSPRFGRTESSNEPSYTSTPSSSFSLEEQSSAEQEKHDGSDDDIKFPSYDDGGDFKSMRKQEQNLEPHASPELIRSDTITPSVSGSSLATPSYPYFCSPRGTAGDDTALRREPTKQVDYFSHNWKEEDIWSSWRHVVAKRKSYSNSLRLENASWRTWTKNKYRLKTTSPDKLDWRKEHDVTWLYGPFQTGSTKPLESDSASSASMLSRSNSFSSKKPILKKRSLSEMMLQRSLSSSTLMRQATDALRAQKSEDHLRERPIFGDRTLSDFVTSSKPTSPAVSRPPTAIPSASTSGAQTPCTKRHIHFNNNVQQCIAINKCEDYYSAVYDGSSSDEDLLAMKPVRNPKFKPGNTPRNSFSSESKTIAMLPSTTLKYRGDTPEPMEPKSNKRSTFWNAGLTLSPSPSQETLKPMSLKANFLLDDEDDDADMNWQPMANRWENTPLIQSQDSNDDSSNDTRKGMRRTPSGMLVPCEEGDDVPLQSVSGFFGKVVDTVNTAKDIAHVIWNVGWRR